MKSMEIGGDMVKKKLAKTIMVQGTTSDAGKSLIVAGLCRLFKDDGYKVAPFKAQNLALNSYVTIKGKEMGRAQVVQAEASGIIPEARMNPILLKPEGPGNMQVMLLGDIWESPDGKKYSEHKNDFVPFVRDALQSLREENDIVVIEGAGSPAEINIKDNEIVNMFVAKMVNSPVLLVADIERGGAFASMLGTIELLDDDEKELIKGMVFNKFRGDKKLLDNGVVKLEELTGKDFLGTLPFFEVDIDEEDSLSMKLNRPKEDAIVDILVVKNPRMSNFTDFDVFNSMDQVNLRYVNIPELFGNPDMVILPGSKNTMEDLKYISDSGMKDKILEHHRAGKPLYGICGGYQILGKKICDPYGIEDKEHPGREIDGLGLLNTITTFEKTKTRTQVNGKFNNVDGMFKCLSGKEVHGYEIHMGRTEVLGDKNLVTITNQNGKTIIDGAQEEKNVYGSYVHGIFESEGIAEAVVIALAKAKNIEVNHKDIERGSLREFKEEQYNKIATNLRENLDMKKIYEVMGI